MFTRVYNANVGTSTTTTSELTLGASVSGTGNTSVDEGLRHYCRHVCDYYTGSTCIYCFKFFVGAETGVPYIGTAARGRMAG